MFFTALLLMVFSTSVGFKELSRPRRYATRPETCGVAIEVPERILVDPSLNVETTLRPGAQTSTPAPKFEKEAFVSLIAEAATVMAC